MTWQLHGLALPPPSERRLLPGEPSTPEQAALQLLDCHAAALAALTLRNSADFRAMPVLAASRAASLAAAFLDTATLTPSLLESLASLVTPRLIRLRGRLRRRLGRDRKEVALGSVREMDPSCLRQNSRRPGRTLIEKAGAHQTLRAVVRVERFDTMENRVLVAASRTMLREAGDRLASVKNHGHWADPRTQSLQRLARAASALLAQPELASVSRPRPGERPSFALLKDPDYRAIYRVLRLLRTQEERFTEEWDSLDAVWQEVLLLATWAVLDAALPGAAVPSWVRALDRRDAGQRLTGSRVRRWLRFYEDYVEGWEVHAEPGGPHLVHKIWLEGDGITDEVKLNWPLGTRPADRRICTHIQRLLSRELGVPAQAGAVDAGSQRQSAGVGIAYCALNAELLACTNGSVWRCGTAAVLTLPISEQEPPLYAFGRAAALGRQGLSGPYKLHGDKAELLGHLIASQPGLAQLDGQLALTVPDAMSEIALRALRRSLGPCWAVWHTVAVGLSFAEVHPEFWSENDGEAERFLLVIALSSASCDLAVLGCTGHKIEERLLIRRPQHSCSLPGLEPMLLGAAIEQDKDAFLAAWLRSPQTPQIWVEQPGAPTKFSRQEIPRIDDAILSKLGPAITDLLGRAGAVHAAVLCGGPSALTVSVEALLSSVRCVRLPDAAAVEGTRIFLERHSSGLPTWEDELPPLRAKVRDQPRSRLDIDLIPGGQRVRPGQQLCFLSSRELSIPPNSSFFDLPLVQGADSSRSFWLHYSGRPLPLRSSVQVRVYLDFRYGFEGLRGELRAVSDGPFSRIPFELKAPDAAEEESAERPVFVPLYKAPEPPTESQVAKIFEALTALRQSIRGVPSTTRREAKKNPSLLAPQMRPLLKRLDSELRSLSATGPHSLPAELRDRLASDVGPFLEWLAHLAKSRDEGDWIALPDQDLKRVQLARSRVGLRHTRNGSVYEQLLRKQLRGEGEERMQEDARRNALMATGRVIDGTPDELWDLLVAQDTSEGPDLFRCQAWGMRRALIAHPSLAPSLSADQAERALQALCSGLGALAPEDVRLRSPFAVALQAIPHLCRVRESGHLMPSNPVVEHTIQVLAALRARAAPAILQHSEGGGEQDEPFSRAIEGLQGRDVHLVFVEKDDA